MQAPSSSPQSPSEVWLLISLNCGELRSRDSLCNCRLQLFRLFHQAAVAALPPPPAEFGGEPPRWPIMPVAFIELLLSLRQFLQALERFINLLIALLLLSALHCFVLVFELVQLELEQIGQILGICLRDCDPLPLPLLSRMRPVFRGKGFQPASVVAEISAPAAWLRLAFARQDPPRLFPFPRWHFSNTPTAFGNFHPPDRAPRRWNRSTRFCACVCKRLCTRARVFRPSWYSFSAISSFLRIRLKVPLMISFCCLLKPSWFLSLLLPCLAGLLSAPAGFDYTSAQKDAPR